VLLCVANVLLCVANVLLCVANVLLMCCEAMQMLHMLTDAAYVIIIVMYQFCIHVCM